ncbi:hypothetical protein JFN88_06310 [Paenibacillus sp. MAHUQ-46]|uniref:Uncharacterized protein n=2 Tax=Paenibacillus TaxID=44249 RepID=A0A934IX64_9BACL|nr:hypothetical protein [Paenibacillus roseus]
MPKKEAIAQAEYFFKNDLRKQLAPYTKQEIEIDSIEVVNQNYFIKKSLWNRMIKSHNSIEGNLPILILQYKVKTSKSEVLLEFQFANVGLENEQLLGWGGDDKLFQLINQLTGLPSLPPSNINE